MASYPVVVDRDADAAFLRLIRQVFPEDAQWEIDNVEHDANRIGHLFHPGICELPDGPLLEFGCNIGATAIVIAHQPAIVTACDIDPQYLRLAQLNARRYGVADRIQFVQTEEGGRLPFRDQSFELIFCNSVLEYIPAARLRDVQRELDRVLRPGGRIVIYGTSNRLWPVEPHSRRWLVNYLPRVADRLTGRTRERGVWPWHIRFGFGPYADVVAKGGSEFYLRSRGVGRDQGGKRAVLTVLSKLAGACGLSPGYVTPFLFTILEKPSRKSP